MGHSVTQSDRDESVPRGELTARYIETCRPSRDTTAPTEVLVPGFHPPDGGSLRVQFAVLDAAAPLHRPPGERQLVAPRDVALDVFLKVLEQSVPPHPRQQVALRRLLQWLEGREGKKKGGGKDS